MAILTYGTVIGVVITVHELGHFLAAKWLGTAIDRFSIGFGRPIAAWTDRAGVEWRLGWLPLGGYVRFSGDANEASVPDGDDLDAMRREVLAREGEAALSRYYHFKPIWQRAVIAAAGPFANFALAIAIFTALLLVMGDPVSKIRVDGVRPGSPAASAGFQVGDVIKTANGRALKGFDDLKVVVVLNTGTPVDFVVDRAGREVPLTATPVRGVIIDPYGHQQRLGTLGVENRPQPGDLQILHYSLPKAVVVATGEAWERIATTIQYVGRALRGQESGDQLTGPIGMAQLSGDVAKEVRRVSPDAGSLALNAVLTLLSLVANISVGIGFINLLPIPVLDGGHLLFYAYEAVARRPLAAKVQVAGFRVGLALVLGLMLFATWNDLHRLRVFNLFGKLFS